MSRIHAYELLTSDGFALNIGRDEWMGARVADAYSAAQSIGDSFKLFLSLDMTQVSHHPLIFFPSKPLPSAPSRAPLNPICKPFKRG